MTTEKVTLAMLRAEARRAGHTKAAVKAGVFGVAVESFGLFIHIVTGDDAEDRRLMLQVLRGLPAKEGT